MRPRCPKCNRRMRYTRYFRKWECRKTESSGCGHSQYSAKLLKLLSKSLKPQGGDRNG